MVHVIRPSSVLTNRKFPQSFHHRKFPVRKPLLHKQRAPQLPTETAEVAEALWAERVGENTVAGGTGLMRDERHGKKRRETKKLFHFPCPWICQEIAY